MDKRLNSGFDCLQHTSHNGTEINRVAVRNMRNQIFNSPGNEEAKLANIPEMGIPGVLIGNRSSSLVSALTICWLYPSFELRLLILTYFWWENVHITEKQSWGAKGFFKFKKKIKPKILLLHQTVSFGLCFLKKLSLKILFFWFSKSENVMVVPYHWVK